METAEGAAPASFAIEDLQEAPAELDASDAGRPDPVESQPEEAAPTQPAEESTMTTDTDTAAEPIPGFLKDEIAPILAAAEKAAAQILDRAREEARTQTAELEATRVRVETRMNELVSWQETVGPSIRSLQVKVADIQSKIDEVPELIRKALDPVATAISNLDPTLAEVAAASRPMLHMDPLNAEPAPSFEQGGA